MWVPPPAAFGHQKTHGIPRRVPDGLARMGSVRHNALNVTDRAHGGLLATSEPISSTGRMDPRVPSGLLGWIFSQLVMSFLFFFFFWGRVSKNISLELVFYSTLLRRPGNIGKHSVAPRMPKPALAQCAVNYTAFGNTYAKYRQCFRKSQTARVCQEPTPASHPDHAHVKLAKILGVLHRSYNICLDS